MAGVNYVPFNRGNLEIKYKWPCCEPAVVEVWSLPKRQGTTHKWGPGAKPPKLDKPYVDPRAPKKSGKEMSAEAAQSSAALVYTGTVRCCSDLHLFPEPVAIAVERRHNPVAVSEESYRLVYGRCAPLCGDLVRVEKGDCYEEYLNQIQLDKDYLTPPQQLELAAEDYCKKKKFEDDSPKQRLIGIIRDGGSCSNGNCTVPHLQCCAQKTVLTSITLDESGMGTSEHGFYDVMSPEPTPLCCEHPCWFESSFCCKHKTCCRCDCCCCFGESRTLKFRCGLCCGEVRHEYPLYAVGATMSGQKEHVLDGGIVVYADQHCPCGNADADLMTALVKLPQGSSVFQAQMLTALAIEISQSYFKIC